jgi:cytochrome-b5 reductase
MCLGLPVGKHFNIRATIDGKIVQRSYTPTSLDDDIGWCELVIKVYFANVHPNFPEGGKMSQYLDGLQIGDHIEVHGPKGLIEYLGHGKLVIKDLKGAVKTSATCKNIGMIAGGTGITPMFQVIKSMLKDPSDNTNVYLLFANQTADDILLSEELNEIASHPNINIWYTLDRAPADWKYSTGFINQDMLRDHMPPPGPDSIILMCGPPPMIKNACIPNLLNLSYSPDFVVAF